jgi:CPA2 family monovalent cation:H+ antiporter-2
MSHDTTFAATIVMSLAMAYIWGLGARVLRLPVIVGYLAAGVLVGPKTPGFVADQKLTAELAEVGIALMMFKIGLHFSVRDLQAVWRVALGGALLQIVGSTVVGWLTGYLLGWTSAASLVLGIAIAISSTAVATKALEERQQVSTQAGRVTLGWLVVQDIVVIVVLVLLPVIASGTTDGVGIVRLGLKTFLTACFVIAALYSGGKWLLPRLLDLTARIGSQELFTLGVIAIALSVAFGLSMLLGVSLALGAFFAGAVLGESDLSHQAAAESLPIQNIFTVLFFVSVGMLFDPMLIVTAPVQIGIIATAIMAGSGLIFFGLLVLLGVRPKTAGLTSGMLAQVGEFSFILTALAGVLAIMSREQQGVLLAAATVSILLHSVTITAYTAAGEGFDRVLKLPWRRQGPGTKDQRRIAGMREHVIVIGHGRVGSVVAAALRRADQPFTVIEGQWTVSKAARVNGTPVIFGDATQPEVLKAARPRHARLIVVALPDAFQSRRVIELARAANPAIGIVARVHSDEEYQYLTGLGVGLVIMGEREIALSMSDYALRQMGLDAARAQKVVDVLREGAASHQ